MGDHSKEVRSYNMSRIRSKNTAAEEVVRKTIFAAGLRYRKNDKRLPGHPDIVLPKYKTVVFVNGCFWHGHEGCRYFIWPKSNIEYWGKKIKGNISRDNITHASLRELGWRVIVVWECELRKDKRESTMVHLVESIKQQIRSK